jgi:hypothetical protein
MPQRPLAFPFFSFQVGKKIRAVSKAKQNPRSIARLTRSLP